VPSWRARWEYKKKKKKKEKVGQVVLISLDFTRFCGSKGGLISMAL